jgi:hypothetical protein
MNSQVPLIEIVLVDLSSALADGWMSAETDRPALKQDPPKSNIEKQRVRNFRFILDLEK